MNNKLILPIIEHPCLQCGCPAPQGCYVCDKCNSEFTKIRNHGFTRIERKFEAYIKGDKLILTFEPDESSAEDINHNCDQMGCGVEHVYLRAQIEVITRQA